MAPTATTLSGESEGNAKLGALGKTTSGKKLKIRSYPKFESLEEERLYRKQHLAAAFRMSVLSFFFTLLVTLGGLSTSQRSRARLTPIADSQIEALMKV